MQPEEVEPRSILVISFDALNAAFLGPYGNTWLPTPGWNQLASQSLLCEQAFTPTTDLPRAYSGVWQAPVGSTTLLERIRSASSNHQFLSDEPTLLESAKSLGFEDVTDLRETPRESAAASLEATLLASQAAKISDLALSNDERRLTWIHLRALSGPWDAPMVLRENLFDEEIGEPPDWIDPRPIDHGPVLEADDLLRWQVAYGAQIQVVDFALQVLLQAIWSLPLETQPALVVTSPRGCNVGSHGSCRSTLSLWTDSVQIPFFVSIPGRTPSLRIQQLVSWGDLRETVSELSADPTTQRPESLLRYIHTPSSPGRDRLLIQSETESALRTHHWFFRRPASGPAELYVKPDDRHDINEVSQRLPAEFEALASALDEMETGVGEAEQAARTPIPDRPHE